MHIKTSLISSQNQLGEGPLWHPDQQALYWVDIHKQSIERYSPDNHRRTTFQFDLTITALGIRKTGGFVFGSNQGFGFWDGESEQVELSLDPEGHLPSNRFNDGAVGPDGCFWAGTMSEQVDLDAPPPGSFYRFSPDRTVQTLESGLHISNGLGWSPDHSFFYLTDSPRRLIFRYQYDPSSGDVGNRQAWVHSPEESGAPDGLAVDSEGCVWSAQWGGWKVIRYDPDGHALDEIHLPVEHPTSCAFGGPDLDELFITSAWSPLSAQQRADQPLAGDLFHIQLKIKGLPVFQFPG